MHGSHVFYFFQVFSIVCLIVFAIDSYWKFLIWRGAKQSSEGIQGSTSPAQTDGYAITSQHASQPDEPEDNTLFEI